jgi:hypothetical protein
MGSLLTAVLMEVVSLFLSMQVMQASISRTTRILRKGKPS